ncbi:protoporphyrinogen oxidase [Pseudohyphozyma bogoriensis]|nr:protoporphyrinogen oxidase [Pseudohyphozyma bogoriensis]
MKAIGRRRPRFSPPSRRSALSPPCILAAPSRLRQLSTSRQASSPITTPESAPEPKTTLAIIGSGLSGLSSAHYFLAALSPEARRSTRVIILDRATRTGGWCNSVSLPMDDGEEAVVFETGPRSIRPVGLPGWLTISLAHALSLTSSILTVPKSHPSAHNRFLLPSTSSYPLKLPSSLLSALTTPFILRLVPRILLEPFIPRSPRHALPSGGDESIDAFFSRRFGAKLGEELASAMVHGIYSGDSRRLSIRACFPGLWEAEREWGFGYLIPRTVPLSKNPSRALGVIFDSDVMPGVDDSAGRVQKYSLIVGGSYWLPPLPSISDSSIPSANSSLSSMPSPSSAPNPNLPSPFPPSESALLEGAMKTVQMHSRVQPFPFEKPTAFLTNTHVDCIPQPPPGYFEELRRTHERLLEETKGTIMLAGGGTGVVGVNDLRSLTVSCNRKDAVLSRKVAFRRLTRVKLSGFHALHDYNFILSLAASPITTLTLTKLRHVTLEAMAASVFPSLSRTLRQLEIEMATSFHPPTHHSLSLVPTLACLSLTGYAPVSADQLTVYVSTLDNSFARVNLDLTVLSQPSFTDEFLRRLSDRGVEQMGVRRATVHAHPETQKTAAVLNVRVKHNVRVTMSNTTLAIETYGRALRPSDDWSCPPVTWLVTSATFPINVSLVDHDLYLNGSTHTIRNLGTWGGSSGLWSVPSKGGDEQNRNVSFLVVDSAGQTALGGSMIVRNAVNPECIKYAPNALKNRLIVGFSVTAFILVPLLCWIIWCIVASCWECVGNVRRNAARRRADTQKRTTALSPGRWTTTFSRQDPIEIKVISGY